MLMIIGPTPELLFHVLKMSFSFFVGKVDEAL